METKFTYRAEWNENTECYEVRVADGHVALWFSLDGDEWRNENGDYATGDPIQCGHDFDNCDIMLVGGPRNGVIVG